MIANLKIALLILTLLEKTVMQQMELFMDSQLTSVSVEQIGALHSLTVHLLLSRRILPFLVSLL